LKQENAMVARYRLVEKCFLREDDHLEAALYEPNDEVLFSGTPHRHFIPLNDEARAAIALIPPLNANAKNIAPRRGDPPWGTES
jgi:hypothetical protein